MFPLVSQSSGQSSIQYNRTSLASVRREPYIASWDLQRTNQIAALLTLSRFRPHLTHSPSDLWRASERANDAAATASTSSCLWCCCVMAMIDTSAHVFSSKIAPRDTGRPSLTGPAQCCHRPAALWVEPQTSSDSMPMLSPPMKAVQTLSTPTSKPVGADSIARLLHKQLPACCVCPLDNSSSPRMYVRSMGECWARQPAEQETLVLSNVSSCGAVSRQATDSAFRRPPPLEHVFSAMRRQTAEHLQQGGSNWAMDR